MANSTTQDVPQLTIQAWGGHGDRKKGKNVSGHTSLRSNGFRVIRKNVLSSEQVFEASSVHFDARLDAFPHWGSHTLKNARFPPVIPRRAKLAQQSSTTSRTFDIYILPYNTDLVNSETIELRTNVYQHFCLFRRVSTTSALKFHRCFRPLCTQYWTNVFEQMLNDVPNCYSVGTEWIKLQMERRNDR